MLVGQIFGVLLAVLSFFVYLQKSRGGILVTKLTLDVLNVLQQAMVGAYTGSVLNGIAIFRELVFYQKDSKQWARSRAWLIIFLLLMGSSPLLSWQGPVSLLPAIGSSLIVIGFYCSDPKQMRAFGIVGQIFWGVYACIILNVGGILGSFLSIVGGIIGLVNGKKRSQA